MPAHNETVYPPKTITLSAAVAPYLTNLLTQGNLTVDP